MTTGAVLAPLPVLIPILGAAATMFAGRRPRLQQVVALVALAAMTAVCAALVYVVDHSGTVAVHAGPIPGKNGASLSRASSARRR